MLDLVDYLLIFVFGSVGGFISGLLGVGGGIIFIPILGYFLPKLGLHDENLVKGILANSLFTIIFSGTMASYQQYKLGNFYRREILFTAIPGILTALLMTYVIRSGNWYSAEFFRYVFASMLLVIALRMFFAKTASLNQEIDLAPLHCSLTGLFAGVVTAMSGLGGGVLMTPVFTDLLKQPFKKASSISNGVIPLFAIFVGVFNLAGTNAQQVHSLQLGYIVFPVVLPMIAAALLFTGIGVRVSHKAQPSLIRNIFALFVSIIFFKTIYEIIAY